MSFGLRSSCPPPGFGAAASEANSSSQSRLTLRLLSPRALSGGGGGDRTHWLCELILPPEALRSRLERAGVRIGPPPVPLEAVALVEGLMLLSLFSGLCLLERLHPLVKRPVA